MIPTLHQPDRGDFVWIDFSPHAGTEQAGRRPGLVLSPRTFNVATGLMFICPITSQVKGGVFEAPVPKGTKIGGVVLCDHIRSLDWIARNCSFAERAPSALIEDVAARVAAILAAE